MPSAESRAGLRPPAPEPADSPAGRRSPTRRPRRRPLPWLLLGVISLGGVLGALARAGLWAVFSHRTGAADWSTWGINVAGCGLLGILMVILGEVRSAHRLARPFLGVGVLGGFTTFSTYIVDVQRALVAGAPQAALLYLTATLGAAAVATFGGVALARLAVRPHRKELS